MDEFIDFMERYLVAVQRELPNLSDEESAAINEFIREAFAFIEEEQQIRETPPNIYPPGTELLWELANGNADAFANYLRTVPDPALNNLLQNPPLLNSIVADLSERLPGRPPEQVQGIERADLNSSNIWGFNYDKNSGRLQVRFQRGPIYEYEGVPPYIFSIFQAGAVPAKTNGQNEFGRWWRGKNPSLGSAFYEMIRSGPYPYERVA